MGANKIIVATAGLAALLAVSPCRQPSVPRRVDVPLEFQEERQVIPPENYEIGLDVVRRNGLAEKVGFHLSPRGQVYASDFLPLTYEIPGVLHGVRELSMEQGAIGATITLGKPQDLSGRRFILYGMHPVTRERVKLYERPFDTVGRHAEPEKRWY